MPGNRYPTDTTSDQVANVESEEGGVVAAGSILARATNVVFTGTPAFYSIQGSYNEYGRPHETQETAFHQPSVVASIAKDGPSLQQSVKSKSFRERTSVDIYRGLDKKKLGVALHIPQPNARLSKAARRRGVCIGSVGRVTPERSFDYMFNICYDASHPVNPLDLQLNKFRPVQPAFSSHDIREFKEFSAGSFLATPGIYRMPAEGAPQRTIGSFACDTNTNQGALLVLPNGGYVEQLTNRPRLYDYIEQNAASLYAYANNTRSRQFKNGDLSIVYSCRNAAAWGIATFHNTAVNCDIKMKLLSQEPSQYAPLAGSGLVWDCQGTVQAKVGPEDDNDDLRQDESQTGSLRNQCLFVRSIRIKLAHSEWRHIPTGRSVSVTSFDSDVQNGGLNTMSQFSSSSSSSPQPSTYSSLSSQGYQRLNANSLSALFSHPIGGSDFSDFVTDEEDDIDRTEPSSLLEDIIMDYLLQVTPEAQMAISSDRDWSQFRSLDCNPYDLLRDICQSHEICQRNGLVYFEPKESSLPENERQTIVQGLDCGTVPLPLHLFGRNQSRQERCTFLGELMHALKSGSDIQTCAESHPHQRRFTLVGHPQRRVSLDEVLDAGPFYITRPPLPIRALRENVNSDQHSSSPNVSALSSQRLGEALLNRYIFRGHLDDLHEAVWALSDVLALQMQNTPSATTGSYRHLELLLDLASALFLRYQILQSADDLHALLCVLQSQKDTLSAGAEAYTWIWNAGPHKLLSLNIPRVYMLEDPEVDCGMKTEEAADSQPPTAEAYSEDDAFGLLVLKAVSAWEAQHAKSNVSNVRQPGTDMHAPPEVYGNNKCGTVFTEHGDKSVASRYLEKPIPQPRRSLRGAPPVEGKARTKSNRVEVSNEKLKKKSLYDLESRRTPEANRLHKRTHSEMMTGNQ